MIELSDKQLHKKFIKIGFQKMALTRKLFALLPEIKKREIFKKKGCTTIQEYALKYAGLSYSAVHTCLSVAKKVERFPLIAEEIENVGLYKAELATKIATTENEQIVVDKMKNLSRSAMRDFVNEVSHYGGIKRKCKAVPIKKSIVLDDEGQKAFNILKAKLGKGGDDLQILKEIFKIAESKLSDKSHKTTTKLLPAVKVSRYIPKKTRDNLYKKSLGLCQYPGCIRCATETHHVDRFSEAHSHEKLLALCKEHHEFAHNGIFKESTDDFCFEYGVFKTSDLDLRMNKSY